MTTNASGSVFRLRPAAAGLLAVAALGVSSAAAAVRSDGGGNQTGISDSQSLRGSEAQAAAAGQQNQTGISDLQSMRGSAVAAMLAARAAQAPSR